MSLRQKGKLFYRILALSMVILTLLRIPAVGTMREPCRKHNNSKRRIALTFDDGPHRAYTEEILEILAEYGIKATFFVVGRNVERYPELVMKELEDGHEIGNHTYSHPHLTNISGEDLYREMLQTEKLLVSLLGICPRLFRPPEGVYSQRVSTTLERLDYIPILWTVDTTDWKKPIAETIAETVISNTEPGVIILCHDFVSGKSNTPAALRIFIPRLLEQGYEFVTISELLRSE